MLYVILIFIVLGVVVSMVPESVCRKLRLTKDFVAFLWTLFATFAGVYAALYYTNQEAAADRKVSEQDAIEKKKDFAKTVLNRTKESIVYSESHICVLIKLLNQDTLKYGHEFYLKNTHPTADIYVLQIPEVLASLTSTTYMNVVAFSENIKNSEWSLNATKNYSSNGYLNLLNELSHSLSLIKQVIDNEILYQNNSWSEQEVITANNHIYQLEVEYESKIPKMTLVPVPNSR